MLQNYLKVAFRNLMKHKIFSFINVFGLAIGLTCCMLITLYITNELSYDTYHKNAGRVFQVGTTFIKPGKDVRPEDRMPNTPALMSKTMQQEFPEIEQSTRLMKAFMDDKTLFQYTGAGGETRSFYESGGFLADSNFFQVLTYRFKEGNSDVALAEPRSIVLSEEIATKLFGNESAVNKVIHISSSTNGDDDYKITGVFVPSKIPSHIDARFFMSMNSGNVGKYMANRTDLATNNMFHTYLLLKKGTDAKKLEAKFPAYVDKYAGKDLKAMGFYKEQFLTNIKDIHLFSRTGNNITPPGSVTYLYILASIALFTLLIACINFMNLSTARSSKRSAEVGIRKVLGAERRSLIAQFLGESLLLSIIGFVLALIITQMLLPLFSAVAGKDFTFSLQQHAVLLLSFFVLAIITGLLAGSYPAFYLSSFKPVKVLKGKLSNSLAAISLRKVLVVFQFVISVILIVASVVITNQMHYMRTKDLGFMKEQQIIIPLRSATAKKIYPALRSELSNITSVRSVGASAYYPGIMHPSDMPLYKQGQTMNEARRVYMNYVDENYLQTLGIKPLAGRLFSKEFIGDTIARVILNESAIKQIGFISPAEAIGKNVMMDWQGSTLRLEVIAVVNDFHFQGLHMPIEPYGFQLSKGNYSYLIAHAQTKDIAATLRSVESSWKKLNPNEPFEYTFLDDDFARNYAADEKLSAIVGYFTIIAIFISCLGLFGLATFSAEQRIKEIGVRKVLGASVSSIVTLLSTDFLKLVIIAIMIASPIAWWAMNKWLQDFAYRTNIGWWIFIVAGVGALIIALITISFQAIRAAVSNPVKSLRTE